MEQDYDIKHWNQSCPKIDCRKKACECGLEYVNIPAALGDDAPGSKSAPKDGAYCNAIVRYEANDHIYVYSKEGIPTLVEGDNVSKELEEEIEARITADEALQDEIDELKNSPDVVDIVATYEDLMDYDTSKLGDNDVIRVLVDETHDNESSYYRWDKTNSQWVFIGAIESYYTKNQTDDLLDEKQDKLTAGSNINIDANNVISGAYTHFTGATASTDGVQGLVPGPLAGDEDKFLKADGTWDTAGSVINVVQTTGASTTDVMSQNATTSMVFADPSNKTQIQIGAGAGVASTSNSGIAIGNNSLADKNYSIAIGPQAKAYAAGSISIGRNAKDGSSGINSSITIGSSLTNNGFNNIGISATGNSTIGTGVQNAVLVGTAKIANSTYGAVSIGGGPDSATYNVVNNTGGVAIGGGKATVSGDYAVALGGWGATASGKGSVALGSYSSATSQGEVNIGSSSTSYGYSNTNYRLLSGVHDGQSLHDAATVAQGNTLATTAPTTSTVGVLGQLYTDTTNMHTYQCTAISGNTYTWTQRW